MNGHTFRAFPPLMLVMSCSEKYRLVKSVGDAAKPCSLPGPSTMGRNTSWP